MLHLHCLLAVVFMKVFVELFISKNIFLFHYNFISIHHINFESLAIEKYEISNALPPVLMLGLFLTYSLRLPFQVRISSDNIVYRSTKCTLLLYVGGYCRRLLTLIRLVFQCYFIHFLNNLFKVC